MDKLRRYLAVAAAIWLGLSLAACASSGSSAGDGKTVEIALVADMTGSFAPFSGAMPVAAYVDEVNSQGGVDGRKIKLTKYDTASDPAQAVQAFRKAIASDPAGIVSTSFVATSALPTVAQSGIPTIGDGFAAGWTDHDTLFSIDGDVATHLSDIYFVDLKKFAGVEKVALIGSPRLKSDLENLAGQASGAGVQIVLQDFGQPEQLTSTDALKIAQQIKQSGAQGVVSIGQQGLPQVQEALNQINANVTVLTTQFGAATKAQDGLLYAAQWATHYTKNNPGVDAYVAAMKKAGASEADLDTESFGPFRYAQVAFLVSEGLKPAGAPFSHSSVAKALNSSDSFTADGLIPPVKFPEFHDVGVNCHAVMKVVDGAWKPLTNGRDPFVCGGPSKANPE